MVLWFDAGSSMPTERSLRWPPRQRIQLSETGKVALAAYQSTVADARAASQAPAALEAGLNAWAAERGIRPSDAVLLEELGKGKVTVGDLARAVEDCGQRLPDVKAGVDRLYGAALIEPPEVKPAGPLPSTTPNRYY
jgi:hypothetical protein